jgi:tetratricopeptide (TPR) repeat protein
MRMYATETNVIYSIKRIAKLLPLAALTIAIGVGCSGETENAQDLFELAQSHQAAGRLDDAVITYTEAVRSDPELTAGYVNRGNIKLQLGAHDGALIDYRKALQLRPDHFGAIFNSGIINYLKGDFDQALDLYNRALDIDPDAFDAYINRGNLYFATGRYEDAIRDFTVVIEKGEDKEHAYYSRGDTYSDLGNFELALADYAYVTTNPYTPFREWIAYHRLERPDEADQIVAEYADTMPSDALPLDAAIVYGYLFGRFDEEEISDFLDDLEAQENDEALVVLCFYVGSAFAVKGDEAEARSYFERGTQEQAHTVSEYASMKQLLRTMDAAAE